MKEKATNKGTPKRPKCRKIRPHKSLFFDTDYAVILVSKIFQNLPKNDTQIDPNGTPGRSVGRLGEPWDPKDVPTTQNDAQMTNINPKIGKIASKMTSKMHGRSTFCDKVM